MLLPESVGQILSNVAFVARQADKDMMQGSGRTTALPRLRVLVAGRPHACMGTQECFQGVALTH